MELVLKQWTSKDYEQLLEYLQEIAGDEYQKFSKKLTPGVENILGIQVPILRDIAKNIAKGDVLGYLSLAGSTWHEEILIHGFAIGYCKLPFTEMLKALESFIPRINNWANCDSVCTTLKIFQRNRAEGYAYLEPKLNSSNPWEIRFVLIQFLSHYLCDEYIDNVLNAAAKVDYDHYYVKMGNAWLLSTAYVKYPDKTMALLKEKQLDPWVHNKTIQKIIESNRVDKTAKERVRKLKIQ